MEIDRGAETEQFEGNFEQRIIDAIQIGDKDQTLELLQHVNEALTNCGQTGNFSPHYQAELKKELNGFINSVKENKDNLIKIYLGDSGISRMFIEKEGDEITIRISNNDSDDVAKKWEQIK